MFTWFCVLFTGQISFDLVLKYLLWGPSSLIHFLDILKLILIFKFFLVETFINWLGSLLKMTTKAFQNPRVPEVV